jgi:hypothetical protein
MTRELWTLYFSDYAALTVSAVMNITAVAALAVYWSHANLLSFDQRA